MSYSFLIDFGSVNYLRAVPYVFFQLQVNSVLEKISSSSQELAHYHSGEGKVHVISYY